MAKRETIGERIASAREQSGMTKSDLARAVEVSPAAVWNWETKGGVPRAAMVEALARALNISEIYLLTGKSPPPVPHRTAADIIQKAKEDIALIVGVPVSRVSVEFQILKEG